MKVDDSSIADRPGTFDSRVVAAEGMLSDVFGSEIRFTNVDRLSEPGRRNLILRCLNSPAGDTPSSYIIKKVEADSQNLMDPDSWDSQRFFNDWIGSQFLSALGGGANHSPQFYGGNRELYPAFQAV